MFHFEALLTGLARVQSYNRIKFMYKVMRLEVVFRFEALLTGLACVQSYNRIKFMYKVM